MVCNAQYRAVMLACNGNVQEKEVQEEKYIALEYKMENYWQLSVLMIWQTKGEQSTLQVKENTPSED